nr:lys-63-specific deubiquitinase BRCC36 [Ciona intestinalis]|eukprot:XP_009862222.1 lys-63-specific deubiquitinase BRCC36 [Ciona intestinalis]
MGSVSRVYLQADAYLSCITHALSNESEEVMGLCIGEMVEKVTGCEIHISAVMLLRRMDKRKDRVEISVEQLSNASTHAEELAKKSGKPLRIVGWYHSHPHITVWPSHVDVQTQAMYQMMDQSFVGLIFSCFNENKANMQTIEATCFQSVRESPEWDAPRYQRIEIPMQIERGNTVSQFNFQTLTNLPKILIQEESEMYDKACGSCGDGVMTQIHNASVHAQSLCNITETITSPLLHVLEATNKKHEMELERIKLENEELKQQIAALSTELEIEV